MKLRALCFPKDSEQSKNKQNVFFKKRESGIEYHDEGAGERERERKKAERVVNKDYRQGT